jgi:hemerythrin
MAFFDWNDSYSVGVSEINTQHKKLVFLINDLNTAMAAGKGRDAVGSIVAELVKYTVDHFSTEERYFDKFKYADADTHKAEHKALVKKVADFQQNLAQGKAVLSIELMNFLKDWLINHIKGTDKKYTKCFNDNGLR